MSSLAVPEAVLGHRSKEFHLLVFVIRPWPRDTVASSEPYPLFRTKPHPTAQSDIPSRVVVPGTRHKDVFLHSRLFFALSHLKRRLVLREFVIVRVVAARTRHLIWFVVFTLRFHGYWLSLLNIL